MGNNSKKKQLSDEERAQIKQKREEAEEKRRQKEAEEARKIASAKRRKTFFTALITGLVIFSLVFSIVLAVSLRSDGSAYLDTRSIEGRDIRYAKISVKGYGDIVVLLDATTAPETVENFLNLANDGFYDGLTFHRIVEDFMIQGGDPLANGSGGSDKKIKGEFDNNGHKNDISHIRGVISMARSGNQYNPASAYNTASSQFFICNADSKFLDGDYAAFGYVISGMSVVDKITKKTVKFADASSGTIANVKKHAVIKSITELSADAAAKYMK